jgi:hypothetical protein
VLGVNFVVLLEALDGRSVSEEENLEGYMLAGAIYELKGRENKHTVP